MPQTLSTPALPLRSSASQRDASGLMPAQRPLPLLQLQAHWQVRAHRRYLEAASFHWPS